jgi:Fe-S-cluster containining protein
VVLGLFWRSSGFSLTGHDFANRVFVFRCTHFDPETRRCDSYQSRPGMCRDYPRLLLWQPRPEFLPGCGYRALPPNAARLRAAVEQAEISDEQRERLRRGLGLD